MRILFLVTLIAALSGCAQYQAQQQQQQYRAQMQMDQQDAGATCSAAYDAPNVAVLKSKIPGDLAQVTLQQMGDTSKATPAEKEAIQRLDQNLAACRTAGARFVQLYTSPGSYAPFLAMQQNSRRLLSQLWSGQITFGQFNTDRSAAYSEFSKQSAAADVQAQQAAASLAAQQEAADAQRTAVGLQFLQNMQTQQQANRPVSTTCNRYGSTVNCWTQ